MILQVDKMAQWQDGKLTNDKMTDWQPGSLQIDKMASWPKANWQNWSNDLDPLCLIPYQSPQML